MKSLRLCETKKLHYGKYLYKLVLANSLNTIFRTELQKDGHLGFARKMIDRLTESYRKGEPILEKRFRHTREVDIEEYFDAKDIYSCLKGMTDYKVRVDPWRSLIIYSNDRDSLLKIANKIRKNNIEFWEPNPESIQFLLTKNNVIVSDVPVTFPYKITLGRSRTGNTADLANWLKHNTDKSKVGDKALAEFERNGYCDGLYFYVRDKKVLMLVQVMIGSKIRRVDKLVYKGDLDKY